MQRVTNVMVQNLMLSDMHNNLSRLLDYQQQLVSGKKYSRPSDHPIDVTRELALQTTLLENTQYIRNQDDAMTWLANTDAAFNQMMDVAHRIRELTIYAGNGALGSGETQAIAAEINELQEELRNIANYSVEGRFLLSGLSTGVRPFERDAQGNVVYMGNTGKVQYEVEKSVVGDVSFHGREVFQEQFSSNTLTSVELPMDFVWSGRDEIIQIAVGERTVKVRLSEDWTDSDRSNIVELTDYNQFRDDGEVEGLTLDQIAEIINNSTEMGDVSRLLSVSVQKDVASGTQRLVFQSHTGEPIQVTGWPETDLVDQPQSIASVGGVPTEDGKITVFVDGNETTVNITAGESLADIAEKLSNITGMVSRVNFDDDTIVLAARNAGVEFSVELTGGARALFSSSFDPLTDETVTVASQPSKRAVDHSHIDFASLLGMETTLKSVQFDGDITLDSGNLHLRFESGANYAELKIDDGGGTKVVTVEELAERIRQVAGDWLEVVVQEDETEAGLGTSLSLEEATKRLLIRPKTNEPLVVFDKNTSGYAMDFGFSTAIQNTGGSSAVFPNIPCVDRNAAAQIKVTVGGEDFKVKLYPDDVAVDPLATPPTPMVVDQIKVMEQIVKQVNAAAGEKLLGYTVLKDNGTPPANTDQAALYALNGESLRIVDLPIADPTWNPSHTAGIAMQMGIATGVTGGTFDPTDPLKTITAGTIRIESLGRTVDVDISTGDTPRTIAEKIRSAGGGWLDVNFFDGDVTDPASGVSIHIAAKDGSPVSIFDVEGNVASTVEIDNAIRMNTAGWTIPPAAGDKLSISVDGYTHTIDLNAIFDSNDSGDIDVEDIAAAINARFQGQDVKAQIVDDGGIDYLVLTSPRGYSFSVSSGISLLQDSADQVSTAPLPDPLPIAAGHTLTVTVGTETHSFALTDYDGDSNSELTLSELRDLAAGIQSYYDTALYSGAVSASVSDDGLLTVISSNREVVSLTATPGSDLETAMEPLALSISSVSRTGSPSARYTQNVVVRTASDSTKTDFFGVIEKLADAVTAEDREGLSNVMLKQIDDFINNLLRCRTSGGALLNRYENNQARFKQNNVYITELYSKVSDVDLAETSTKFLMAQAVYQSSLAVIAKIVQPTLVDFLR